MTDLNAPQIRLIDIFSDPSNPPVFVFGSNERGIHGGGAAKAAHVKHGAVMNIGFGHQGNSFAIPTCSKPTGQPGHEISVDALRYYIDCFLLYAVKHPELTFQVTAIGCGLAGWKSEDVAPMFALAPDNCYFDTEWGLYLPPNRAYWGTVPSLARAPAAYAPVARTPILMDDDDNA